MPSEFLPSSFYLLKILLLKPSSLGDVVQALPVLRRLKQHRPASEVWWWIDSALAPLLEGDPDLAGVVHFERRRWTTPRHWPEMWRSLRWMQAQRFDWVIDLQGLARSGTFAWLARGKLLVGLDEPREGARGFYDLIVPRATYHTHAVDWYLGVLRVLGVPANGDFEWLPVRPSVAAAVRRQGPGPDRQWLALLPGARWPNKCWPAEHFASLVRLLDGTGNAARLVILGGESDREIGRAIAQAAPQRCLDLTGQTSLPEMVEWLRRSRLVVCNDTGPMHVAAALGTPVIALFGPTEPRRTGPYGQIGHVLQTPLPCVPCLRPRCHYKKPMECLRAISPEQVAAAVRRRWTPGP